MVQQVVSDTKEIVAIQGELGSNSHNAALQAMSQLGKSTPELLACTHSAEVFEALAQNKVAFAVLPIENSLHGSVAEHYDLLLHHDVAIVGELQLRIGHNVIVAPGVRLADIRQVLSHPVALSQCRRWLHAHPHITVVPFYDTAGSVKHVIAENLRDAAGIAPLLAAAQYDAEVLLEGIEDHAENYTRFYILQRGPAVAVPSANKLSLAFTVEHRPGTLLAALESFRSAGLNLTRIESRPVHGSPWEYIFFVDLRFEDPTALESALTTLRAHCQMVKELGRYPAA